MQNNLIKKIGGVLCIIALAATILCAQDTDDGQTNRHVFTIIDGTRDYDLNPHTASYSSEAQILINIYEGLFAYDPATLDPKEALAKDYHISRDQKRWTFFLQKDVKFSNGEPITAEAIRESWLDLLATPNAPYASLLDIVRGARDYRTGNGKREDVGIKAINDSTLVVLLTTPASYFPRLLCHHAFAAVNKDLHVASGAYLIAKREKNAITLLRNPQYWDASSVKIPEIQILQSDDTAETTYDFNTGKADWLTGGFDIDSLLEKDAVKINAEFGTQYLFFKCGKAPWNNPDFRNALLAAVPWDKLRAGSLVPATSLVYPLNGYPSVTGFDYTDIYEADDLMADARKAAGIPTDKRLNLTFAITDTDYMKKEAEILKTAWAPLGVDLSVKSEPADSYLSSIPTLDADLFSYSWIGDFADPLAFLELFRKGSTLNSSLWSNEKFDMLLDQAAAETGKKAHLSLLSKAEQILLDAGVVLPISHPVSLNAIDLNRIGGWSSNSFDIHPFKYLYFMEEKSDIPNIVMR